MKKLRSGTVEPVLGTLVNFLGMGRVNTKGIKQANKCMMMAALAYNLKKLLKWKSNKTEATVKTLPRRVKTHLFITLCPNMNRRGRKSSKLNIAYYK